jgi:hypothetical protein
LGQVITEWTSRADDLGQVINEWTSRADVEFEENHKVLHDVKHDTMMGAM